VKYYGLVATAIIITTDLEQNKWNCWDDRGINLNRVVTTLFGPVRGRRERRAWKNRRFQARRRPALAASPQTWDSRQMKSFMSRNVGVNGDSRAIATMVLFFKIPEKGLHFGERLPILVGSHGSAGRLEALFPGFGWTCGNSVHSGATESACAAVQMFCRAQKKPIGGGSSSTTDLDLAAFQTERTVTFGETDT
jgi:hypothetical protein